MLLSAFAAQLDTAVIYFCHMLQAKCSTELIIFKKKKSHETVLPLCNKHGHAVLATDDRKHHR